MFIIALLLHEAVQLIVAVLPALLGLVAAVVVLAGLWLLWRRRQNGDW